MLSFASIAIFVMTSVKTAVDHGADYNFFIKRVSPIAQTWGHSFDNLYFTMGRPGEYRSSSPKLSCQRGTNSSMLSKYALNDQLEFLHCNSLGMEAATRKRIKLIVFQNCSASLHGAGTVCRAQEAMRFFLYSQHFKNSKWFLVLDDDVFLRPPALLSLLQSRTMNASGPMPLALVGNDKELGFSKSRAFKKCKPKLRPMFAWARPALLNRDTLQELKPSIDKGVMMNLRTQWGGSGDIILGAMLWLLAIPVYNIDSKYHCTHAINRSIFSKNAMSIDKTFSDSALQPISKYIIVEKVSNRKIKRGNSTITTCSQWALYNYYNSNLGIGEDIKLGNMAASNGLTISHHSMKKSDLNKKYFHKATGKLLLAGAAVGFNISNCM